MATFKIHEDQENHALQAARKENAETSAANLQRRALGDLNQLSCNQQRNTKFTGPTDIENLRLNDGNKFPRKPTKFDKPVLPPVSQFRAFSVYEDKPPQNDTKKREPQYKPFSVFEDKANEKIFIKDVKEDIDPEASIKQELDSENDVHTALVAVPKDRFPLQDKFRDVSMSSPMSLSFDNSMSSLSIPKSDKKHQDEIPRTSSRVDRELFYTVAEYREDIYVYMRDIEAKHRASPGYMRKQPDISYGMRAILVDWLAEVCEEYKLQAETLHLAVSYVDRFLSYMSVVRAKLQLVGTSAMFIASKYEEIYPPDVNEFVYITDDTYTKKQVLRMEHLILKVLSFDLSTPTSLAFISHFCISNRLSRKIEYLAMYIAELSLLEADPYLQFRASIIGASALATARHCLLCKRCNSEDTSPPESVVGSLPNTSCLAAAWSEQLAAASGYTTGQLEACMRELARTHSNAQAQPHQAIPEKYKCNKFESVSTIAARPIYHVPKYQPPTPAPTASRPAPEAGPADQPIQAS